MPSLVSLDSPGQGNSVAAKLDKAREVELSDAAGDHLTNLDRRELILRLQTTVQGFAKSAYLNNKVHTALEQIQLVDAVQEARLVDSRNLNAASVAIANKLHDAKDATRIEKGQVQKHSYYLKRATLPNKADIDLKYWGKVVEWHAGANIKRDKLVPMYAVTEGAPNFLIDFTCCSDAFDSSFCTAALVRKVPEKRRILTRMMKARLTSLARMTKLTRMTTLLRLRRNETNTSRWCRWLRPTRLCGFRSLSR